MKRRMLTVFAVMLLVSGWAGTASAAIINGDFESGSFSGWTQFGNVGFTSIGGGATAHSGSFGASFGPVGSTGGIVQTLATTAGTQYELSYWLRHDGGNPNSVLVEWNGIAQQSLVNDPGFGYTEFTFLVTATAPTTDLRFTFQQNPAFYYLDDVSVEAVDAVPEPATLTMFGLGALGFAGAALRRRFRKIA